MKYFIWALFYGVASFVSGQNTLYITDTSEFENIHIYNVDSFHYTLSNDKTVITVNYNIREPNFLMIQYKSKNKKGKMLRLWSEVNEKIHVKFEDFKLKKINPNWLDSAEKIYDLVKVHPSEYIDSLKIDYIKRNSDFLSIYYFSHLMFDLPDTQLKTLYNLIVNNGKETFKYPTFREISDYVEMRIKNLRLCQNTNDSLVDFNFINLDSLASSSREFRKKYLLIYFTYPGCVPCKKTTPHLSEIYNKYKGDSIDFLLFTIAKPSEFILQKRLLKTYNLISAFDFKGQYSEVLFQFGINQYPTLLVFKDRKLLKKYDDANMIMSIKSFENQW